MLYKKKKEKKYNKSDTIPFLKSISLDRDVSVLSKEAPAVLKYTNKLLCEWWLPNYANTRFNSFGTNYQVKSPL